ncbi:bacillithiol biosynthesis cysteine-adding enzyme BshC [Bacillus sp. CGMCC 1.16607]|uniref:bacillithiol biosynthesis cysteine-adding enzyme BshC n=1 Tax=Bacillus sp. CGMCC 1.16607 TaxID=3351842 RepID=UPI0036395EAF
MEMINLSIPATNRFASGYLQQNPEIMDFFDYRYGDIDQDKERLKELQNRIFPREVLADHIKTFMKRYPTSLKVQESLEKLKNPKSTVVIGGQQAGILTGPLYSIHKVISIIKLAEKKEKELNIPVVPVFWIAGEDHDYHEVNHVYVPSEQKLLKKVYPEKMHQKKMVSDISLDHKICEQWAFEVMENLGETEKTQEMKAFLQKAIEESNHFVDFFAYIIMELFKDKGLLLVDSGNKDLRNIEKEFFIKQIENHGAISNALDQQQQIIKGHGYPLTIDASLHSANLFYYEKNYSERLLLEFSKEKNSFISKNKAVSFSEAELLNLANEYPERLSNNVVTRPLMQELLFPTIAFIAGPGEIAYWAELKKVFEIFAIKMPPIVPRLNFTFLERAVERDIEDLGLSVEEVLRNGTSSAVSKFFSSVKDSELEEQFLRIKEQVSGQYQIIEKKLTNLDQGLLPLLSKNEAKLLEQIDFMKSKIEQSIQQKHENTFQKFNRIENFLRPNGGPQERTWNVFYFLNKYGFSIIHEMMNVPLVFDGYHKVIKI